MTAADTDLDEAVAAEPERTDEAELAAETDLDEDAGTDEEPEPTAPEAEVADGQTGIAEGRAGIAGEEAGISGDEVDFAGKEAAAAGEPTGVAGGQVDFAGKEAVAAGESTGVAGGEADIAGGQVGIAGEEVVAAGGEADVAGEEVVAAGGQPRIAGERADIADGEGRVGDAEGGVGEDEEVEVAERLDEPEFRAALEAMLLIVDAPATVEQLATALDDSEPRVEQALREMSAELSARGSGIDLRFVGDGWRFYTRTEYAPYVERMLLDGSRSKLTRAALETLAVIAYRQPVTRARVSAVRGVNVDGVIRTLVARGLIAESGTDPETNGTQYVTTELFLERVGLASLADLPPLAPLLPGVDLIDEINESLDTDPRYTRLKKPAESELDLGTED